jgi:hypothetical protein
MGNTRIKFNAAHREVAANYGLTPEELHIATKAQAHRVEAQSLLKCLETMTGAWHNGHIDSFADQIPQHLAAAGIAVDDNVTKRIKNAKARAHRVAAQGYLEELETRTGLLYKGRHRSQR